MSAAAVATPPTAQPAIAGTVVCGDSAERTPAEAASQPLSIKDGNQSATGAELKRHRTESPAAATPAGPEQVADAEHEHTADPQDAADLAEAAADAVAAEDAAEANDAADAGEATETKDGGAVVDDGATAPAPAGAPAAEGAEPAQQAQE